jgi:hypothetical protein
MTPTLDSKCFGVGPSLAIKSATAISNCQRYAYLVGVGMTTSGKHRSLSTTNEDLQHCRRGKAPSIPPDSTPVFSPSTRRVLSGRYHPNYQTRPRNISSVFSTAMYLNVRDGALANGIRVQMCKYPHPLALVIFISRDSLHSVFR